MESTTSRSETYTYDALGRVSQLQKVISGVTYTLGYSYNLAGQVTSLTYPSGRIVTHSYDSAGRLSSLFSGATQYVNTFAYNSAGQVTGFKYGSDIVTAAFGFSAQRLQLESLSYTKNGIGQPFFSLSYCYWQDCDGQSGGNNGQIIRITDNVSASRTLNYTYDALRRLKTAVAGPVGAPVWGLEWLYDRWGNREEQRATAGSPPAYDPAVDPGSNRIVSDSNHSYDAIGNMTKDGQNTLTYDAENNLATMNATPDSGVTHQYDSQGLRVWKQDRVSCGAYGTSIYTTRYVYSADQLLAEYRLNNPCMGQGTILAKEFVYAGGSRVAIHTQFLSSDTLVFLAADHLSDSTRGGFLLGKNRGCQGVT